MRLGLLLGALLLPAVTLAWEEEPAIAFILADHPVVVVQRNVAAAYQPPGTLRRVLEHTSFYVRAASGTSTTVAEGGDTTTTSSPMTVGVQINIPLASPREQREYSQQALAEATRIDEVRGRALTDLAKLRELEAERAAVRERLTFHRSKADWVQERVTKGYEGDVEKLWESAQKQNTEAAAARRLDLLIDSQRRQVAHHAGDHWEPLFKYLADRGKLPE